MPLDLKKYAGTWYQVARNNAFYEAGCENSVAVYTVGDGFLGVTNYCYRRNVSQTISAPPIPGFPDLVAVRKITGRAFPTSEPPRVRPSLRHGR